MFRAKIQAFLPLLSPGCYTIGPYTIALSREKFSFLRSNQDPLDNEIIGYGGSKALIPILSGHPELAKVYIPGYKPAQRISKYTLEELGSYFKGKGYSSKKIQRIYNKILDEATQCGDYGLNLFKHFSEKGILFSFEVEKDNNHPLFAAAIHKNKRLVEYLIESKKQPLFKDLDGDFESEVFSEMYVNGDPESTLLIMKTFMPSAIDDQFLGELIRTGEYKLLAREGSPVLWGNDMADGSFILEAGEAGDLGAVGWLWRLGDDIDEAFELSVASWNSLDMSKYLLGLGAKFKRCTIAGINSEKMTKMIQFFSQKDAVIIKRAKSFYRNLRAKELIQRL